VRLSQSPEQGQEGATVRRKATVSGAGAAKHPHSGQISAVARQALQFDSYGTPYV